MNFRFCDVLGSLITYSYCLKDTRINDCYTYTNIYIESTPQVMFIYSLKGLCFTISICPIYKGNILIISQLKPTQHNPIEWRLIMIIGQRNLECNLIRPKLKDSCKQKGGKGPPPPKKKGLEQIFLFSNSFKRDH